MDGRNVFIHTGTLMQAKTPNEVIGIIAHETGHIAGGTWRPCAAAWRATPPRALLLTCSASA